MRLSAAFLLTLLPPLIGLSLYYLSVYNFTLSELLDLIFKQLWYLDFNWLLIAFGVNIYLVSKIVNLEHKLVDLQIQNEQLAQDALLALLDSEAPKL